MEVKPPGVNADRMTVAFDSANRSFPMSNEKYKGSKKAAERSRTRSKNDSAKTPLGDRERSKRKALPGWFLPALAVAVFVFVVTFGLKQMGLIDLPSLIGVTPKNRPEVVVNKPVDPPPVDPLKNLIALKKKFLTGQNLSDVRKSFNQGCLGRLALAVDYYDRNLTPKGNQTLSDLGDILTAEFLEKVAIDEVLILKGVSARRVRFDSRKQTLIIDGLVENGSARVWDRVLLLAVLSDKAGVVIAKSFTLAGRTIPEDEYFKPFAVRSQTLLNTLSDPDTILNQESSAPFLFVFSNPPKSVKRFSVKIVLAPEGPEGR